MSRRGRPGRALRRHVDYLGLQPTREGQASHAHVNEIVAGLRRRSWTVRLIVPPKPRPGRLDGMRRAVAALVVQARYFAACRFQPAPFIYIRTSFMALPTATLGKLTGSFVIQEMNGPIDDAYDAWPQLRPLHRLIALSLRLQFRWADAIICVTPGLIGYLRTFSGRQDGYHVVGNGAAVERFVPRSTEAPPNGRPYVVFVGALASWQGIDTVLAAKASSPWPDGVDLVIAGEGVMGDRVAEAAATDPGIRWLGTVPYADSPGLMADSIAALVPMIAAPRSRFGLSPLKLYEGMAAGVPVIVSDLSGLAEVVRAHGCGVIVRAGDAQALALAVAAIAAAPNEARQMGERGRAAAVGRYSWDTRAGQTEEVLLRVAGDREIS